MQRLQLNGQYDQVRTGHQFADGHPFAMIHQDKSRQLAGASRHKSHFLPNMSHELLMPLNAINGVGEMLRDAEALKQDPSRSTACSALAGICSL
jgi:hypothetical protein